MVRLSEARESGQAGLNDPARMDTSIPLYKAEKRSIQPGTMNWLALKADMEVLEHLLKSSSDMTPAIVGKMEAINDRVNGWVDGYVARNSPRIAILGFWYHWKLLRTWVPLQFRLCVEQALYERGEPWRQLVTGFGVVKAPTGRRDR